MEGKVCVVTGGNTGIGFEIVRALAKQSAHVVLISRNESKGKTAVNALQTENLASTVDLIIGDLSTISNVKHLSEKLAGAYPKIDVLINNAGVWMTKKVINEDNLEMSFMVNHLAPFMLNQMLLTSLKASEKARVVNVSAGLYERGVVDVNKTPYGDDFGRIKSYANSKLCNVLTLSRQAEKLENANITFNMVHPGVIRTQLGDSSGPIGWLLKQIKKKWSTPEAGAIAPVWLATAPELASVNGRYFNEKEPTSLHPVAQNLALADAIWDLSTKLIS
ncbi:MAG: SDR family NAD(P)-dependent oxidoreductase [Chloroflexota bacterium]